MSLVSQLKTFATRVGTEFKSVRSDIGNLASLTTSNKDSLVQAINEVKTVAEIGGGGNEGAGIDDNTATTVTTYSSSKIESLVATKAEIDDSAVSSSKAYSSSKTVSAIEDAVSTKPNLDDTTSGDTTVYSSSKTEQVVQDAIDGVVGEGASEALDTLRELADAIGNDENFAATISESLGNRVAVNKVQEFSLTEREQGRDNIGAVAKSDIGDTNTDFVQVFETALT